MHLHGFYFRIDALRGRRHRLDVLPPDQRPMAVTQTLAPFETMAMTWAPDAAGDWLFHCHIGFHVVPDTRLDPPAPRTATIAWRTTRTVHMAGWCWASWCIRRRARPSRSAGKARRLHLFVQEGPRRGPGAPGAGLRAAAGRQGAGAGLG